MYEGCLQDRNGKEKRMVKIRTKMLCGFLLQVFCENSLFTVVSHFIAKQQFSAIQKLKLLNC